MKYRYNETQRNVIKNSIINGSRKYNHYLCNKDFLIVTDSKKVVVHFRIEDFNHLSGVQTSLSDIDFYKDSVKGILTKENINDTQHYNISTIKQKVKRIENIEKIMYTGTSTSLFLTDLHTNTTDFPYAIENPNLKTVIGFSGDDNHARTLRKNNTVNADLKEPIKLILTKNAGSSKYDSVIYVKDKSCIDAVKDLCLDDFVKKMSNKE